MVTNGLETTEFENGHFSGNESHFLFSFVMSTFPLRAMVVIFDV